MPAHPLKKPRRNSLKAATLADLKQPIVLQCAIEPSRDGFSGFGLLERTPTEEEAEGLYVKAIAEKLALALTHFSINQDNPDRWLLLSWRLAEKLGWLNVRRSPEISSGRPQEWQLEDCLALKSDVEAIISERGRGIQDACRTLVKRVKDGKLAQPVWMNGKAATDLQARTLANRYSFARKQADTLFSLARLGNAGQ